MTRFRTLSRKIYNKVNDRILLAYVIWLIKAEELRSKFETWTYKQDENIKDRE